MILLGLFDFIEFVVRIVNQKIENKQKVKVILLHDLSCSKLKNQTCGVKDVSANQKLSFKVNFRHGYG